MYWLVVRDATEDGVTLLTLRHFQVSNLQCPHGVCNHFQRRWAGKSFSPSQADLSFRHGVSKGTVANRLCWCLPVNALQGSTVMPRPEATICLIVSSEFPCTPSRSDLLIPGH